MSRTEWVQNQGLLSILHVGSAGDSSWQLCSGREEFTGGRDIGYIRVVLAALLNTVMKCLTGYLGEEVFVMTHKPQGSFHHNGEGVASGREAMVAEAQSQLKIAELTGSGAGG